MSTRHGEVLRFEGAFVHSLYLELRFNTDHGLVRRKHKLALVGRLFFPIFDYSFFMRQIKSKTILSTVKPDPWFRISYNMNLYRGCTHGCIYCDSRSVCYHVENFDEPAVKENAAEMLAYELARKKKKGIIGFGSMNDPYMPAEALQMQTLAALKVIERRRFPVHIITKSNLVLRDINVLKSIAQVYAAVSVTITTSDDELASKIEPLAPTSTARFEVIRRMREEGIHAGVTFMPVLPFINDTEENVRAIVARAVTAGAEYIIPYLGVTLREGSREYFYQKLDTCFPGIRQKYEAAFEGKYECQSPNAKALYRLLDSLCRENGIAQVLPEYKVVGDRQMDLFNI